ncbi:hypothetical protein LWC35_31420, partial [Pseudonocardia kujensis]|nr:hypothetical protein [Pseudonocardia kujensis]
YSRTARSRSSSGYFFGAATSAFLPGSAEGTSLQTLRQSGGSSTTGKSANHQPGVFLAYAGVKGRALIDSELDNDPTPLVVVLCLPTPWTEAADRCARAGILEGAGFATKPAGAFNDESGVTADKAHAQNRAMRAWLADHEVPFVLAACNDDVFTLAGARDSEAGQRG